VHDKASVLALPLEDTVPPAVLEAVVRAVAAALSPRQLVPVPREPEDDGQDLPPLLSPVQAGRLIGVSRQTIDRMVADKELPSIVLREGTRQRMVRIPKAFVLQLLRDLNAGMQVSLKDYTARWLASAAGQPAAAARYGVPPAEVA
jgi:excisionase family DNA binding protein